MSPWFSNALLRAQSDERLVVLARAGHEGAFVAIVERYRRSLHAFARRLVPEARVEDVLQQAFVNAWAALDAGAEVHHLRGWLHQIVRNAAIAAARRPGEAPLSEAMPGADGPHSEVERRLQVRETLGNVARLPDHQRTVIVETAVAGRSREQVASDLGLTEGAVRGLLHRARTSLRAAATAITPFPLAAWAASGGGRGLPVADRIVELAAGAGSASLAGATVKAGSAVVVSGALATSLATELPPAHRHHRHAPTVSATTQHAKRPAVVAVVTSTPTRRASRSGRAQPATTHRAAATRPVVRVRLAPAPRQQASQPAGSQDAPRRATREHRDDGTDDAKAPTIPVAQHNGESDSGDDGEARAASDDHGGDASNLAQPDDGEGDHSGASTPAPDAVDD